jgi:glycosyltransferase involved in cell wall biosynthesis
MKVLYIHTAGAFGGASRSLFEAVRALDSEVVPRFVTPRGTVEPFFETLGEVVTLRGLTQFDNTRYSHYRGLRWFVLLRELAYLPGTIAALRRAHARWGDVDLVHVNELTGIVAAKIARRLFRVPLVVHVRSLTWEDRRSWRVRRAHDFLRHDAAAIVAIDENVRSTLPADLRVQVIHNSFRPGAPTARQIGGDGPLRVGYVGNLQRAKGVIELVEAARIVTERGLDVRFELVGDHPPARNGLRARLLKAAGISQYVGDDVRALIDRYGLGDRVRISGFTPDIGAAYSAFDVLAFPSHLDAPGRPIFEAAFAGIPSIVAVKSPKADTLVDGVTGLALATSQPEEIAAAIARLAGDRSLLRQLGEAAQALARRNFDPRQNAKALLDVYRSVLNQP